MYDSRESEILESAVCVETCVHPHICIYIHTCICTSMHIHILNICMFQERAKYYSIVLRVREYMYMYIYAFTYTYTYVYRIHIHTHMYVSRETEILNGATCVPPPHTHDTRSTIRACTYMHIHIHTHMYVIYTYIHTCMYEKRVKYSIVLRVWKYMYVYIYAYTYTYTCMFQERARYSRALCVWKHLYEYTYMHIYTHTHVYVSRESTILNSAI